METRGWTLRNLHSGARNGLSYSNAPATYIILPRPSSKLSMFTTGLLAMSLVQITSRSARRAEIPRL